MHAQGMCPHFRAPPPRSEVDLRQKLAQRDERVAALKQELAAKGRTLQELGCAESLLS